MGRLLLALRRAGANDFEAVLGLVIEASQWLRTKDTDQWAVPWPDANGRKERITRAIGAGRIWIAWDGNLAAATLTASPNHHQVWPPENWPERAVYVRRITVSRTYSGLGLGGQLIDWAGLRASREYGARWIRADVWTTNTELHGYYRRQGFEYAGLSPVPGYPSAALFQKPTDQIRPPEAPLFRDAPESLFREAPEAAKAPWQLGPARGPATGRAARRDRW
jgi:ribosomal protein S18 acetylase RimI-like enzyme